MTTTAVGYGDWVLRPCEANGAPNIFGHLRVRHVWLNLATGKQMPCYQYINDPLAKYFRMDERLRN